MPVNPLKLALVAGLFLAVWHACWSLLVWLGIAQTLVNFVFWIYFLSPHLTVEAFERQRALFEIITAFTIGLVVGGGVGIIWNLFQRGAPDPH